VLLNPLIGLVGIVEAVVQRGENFIHALDILDARIQLGIDEQDLCEYVCVRLYIVEAIVATKVSFLEFSLSAQLLRVVSELWISRINEEIHVLPRALDVLLDFNPNFLIVEVSGPKRLLFVNVQGVVNYIAVLDSDIRGLICRVRSQIRLDYKLLLPVIVDFLLLTDMLLPLVRFQRQIANQNHPDDLSKRFRLRRDASKCQGP